MDVRAPALAEILPPAAVGAETVDPGEQAVGLAALLFEEELPAVARASERRRREFVGGRACARAALALLGREPVALPMGSDGAPLWPAGIVGSITHKGAYRAAAVARADALGGIGLDAEVDADLPPGVLGRLATPGELEMVDALRRDRPGRAWDRLLFSAKEAAVKAAHAPPREVPGLEATEVRLDGDARSLSVVVRLDGRASDRQATVEGRWAWRAGMVIVAGWLSAPS